MFVPFFSPHYTFKKSLHIEQHNRSATKLLLYIGHRRPVWMIQTYQSVGKNQISAINYLYKTSSISLLPLQHCELQWVFRDPFVGLGKGFEYGSPQSCCCCCLVDAAALVLHPGSETDHGSSAKLQMVIVS